MKATGELRTRAAVGDEADGAHFEINDLPEPFGWDDAQGRMFLKPVKQGEIGGFPVYDNTLYVLRPGDAMFARVTMGRFIKACAAELRKQLDTAAAVVASRRRQAEPCLLNATGYDTWKWTIVPVGTTGCRRVVHTNFDLFRRNLPRSALQVISVPQVTNCSYMLETDKSAREDPGGCLAVVRILRSLDWQQLAGLLQK